MVSWSGDSPAQEDEALKGMKFAFDVQVTDLVSRTTGRRTVLFGQYATAVESQQKIFQEAGDLENALKARDEASLARKENQIGSREFPAIQSLRETLQRELNKIAEEENLERASLAAEYAESLSAKQTEYTKAGQLEQALAIKQQIAALTAMASPPAQAQPSPVPGTDSSVAITPQPPSGNLSSKLYKSLDEVGRLFGIGTDVSGTEQITKVNETLAKEVVGSLAAWTVRVETREGVAIHGNSQVIVGGTERVRIGNREFSCKARLHCNSHPQFDGRKRGDAVRFVGRVAHCRISAVDPGVLLLEVANVVPPNSGAMPPIPAVAKLEILVAKWGPKDVKDIILRRVVDNREAFFVNNKSMEGDPNPGWIKQFHVKFKIDDQQKELSWTHGEMSYAVFFRENLTQAP